jgi:hypothetical protein
MKETELKPCPFCGSKAKIIKNTNECLAHGVYGESFVVFCTGCFLTSPKEITYGQAEDACITNLTHYWNRRADNEQREAVDKDIQNCLDN